MYKKSEGDLQDQLSEQMELMCRFSERERDLDGTLRKPDGVSMLIKVPTEIGERVSRVVAAHSALEYELSPHTFGGVKSARQLISVTLDRLSRIDRTKDSTARVVMDCGDLKENEDPTIWQTDSIQAAVEAFAKFYQTEPDIFKREDAIMSAKRQFAQWSNKYGIKNQGIIITGMDKLPAQRQILMGYIFLGKLVDLKNLSAYLLHENDVTLYGEVDGLYVDHKFGAPQMNEGRFEVAEI